MITIKKDHLLAIAEAETGVDWERLSNDIIAILRPEEDYYVGFRLDDYCSENDYSVVKLLCDIDIRPTTAAIKAVSALTLWYEDADNPCAKCGYEVMIDDSATTDDREADEDGSVTFVGRCPICQTITLIRKPINQ